MVDTLNDWMSSENVTLTHANSRSFLSLSVYQLWSGLCSLPASAINVCSNNSATSNSFKLSKLPRNLYFSLSHFASFLMDGHFGWRGTKFISFYPKTFALLHSDQILADYPTSTGRTIHCKIDSHYPNQVMKAP